jgi:hypothetical protein
MGLIRRLKELDYKNFYLPFYFHKINSSKLTDVNIEEVNDKNDNNLAKLNLIYTVETSCYKVQGKNSSIPTFD